MAGPGPAPTYILQEYKNCCLIENAKTHSHAFITEITMFILNRTAMLVSVVCLAACSTQPAYQRPALALPASWANASAAATPSDSNESASSTSWWRQLHDPA